MLTNIILSLLSFNIWYNLNYKEECILYYPSNCIIHDDIVDTRFKDPDSNTVMHEIIYSCDGKTMIYNAMMPRNVVFKKDDIYFIYKKCW